MATYTPLRPEEARRIGAEFGLDVTGVVGIAAGSVNSNYRLSTASGQRVLARVYEEQDGDGAEGEARLLDHLARGGVATPRPLCRLDGAGFTSTVAERPVSLFPWCEGETLCQARVTARIAHRVGIEIARVHLAGVTFGQRRVGRFRLEDLRARLHTVARAEDPEIQRVSGALAGELDRCERECDAGLPSGIIHGDLFRDNVLWQDSSPSALLDFESASDGLFIYDLMVTVLAWCYRSDLDQDLVRSMARGYRSVRPLSEGEIAALHVQGRIAALRFTITRITDYALRGGEGERVMKDWRRFWARHQRILSLGNAELARLCA
jgi:homoserine kinase type II